MSVAERDHLNVQRREPEVEGIVAAEGGVGEQRAVVHETETGQEVMEQVMLPQLLGVLGGVFDVNQHMLQRGLRTGPG